MQITITEGSCFLGKTLVISNGTIEVEVTTKVGPRIISLKKVGSDNIFFQDLQDSTNKDISHIYGEGQKWHIYGGHRLWLSPEDETTYYPDNKSVSYTKTPTGAIFTPPYWEVHNVQTSIEVSFVDDNSLDVIMKVINVAEKPKDLCIWALTVLKSGGTLEVNQEQKDAGYLSNRNLVFWSYSRINDARFSMFDNKIVLKSNTTETKPFKVGLFNANLRTEYTLGNNKFTKTLTSPKGIYPDSNCNMETYTNNLIHEVETLSPITTVNSGETLTHSERWELI